MQFLNLRGQPAGEFFAALPLLLRQIQLATQIDCVLFQFPDLLPAVFEKRLGRRELHTGQTLLRLRIELRQNVGLRNGRQIPLQQLFSILTEFFNEVQGIEELGEDGKKLLERYLPPIPQADVLSQLNEQTQQRLSGLQLPSPETFLKNRREEIRELEQNAVYLSGKLDLAQKQRQSSKDLSDRLTAQIQELQREIASLEARRFENINLEDLQEPLHRQRSW